MIKIFNPKNIEYGSLSNNYTHDMNIYSKKRGMESYKSVTNYIYSNLLNSPIYRGKIKNCKAKLVTKLFGELYQQEIDDVVSRALDEALEEKFKDEKMVDMLLDTGRRPIIYASSNTFLGVSNFETIQQKLYAIAYHEKEISNLNKKFDEDSSLDDSTVSEIKKELKNQHNMIMEIKKSLFSTGFNLYGKKLEQLRATFKEKRRNEEKNKDKNELYTAYMAYQALRNALKEGSNLEEYENLQVNEIIDTYGRKKISSVIASIDSFEDIHKFDQNFKEILKFGFTNPNFLISNVKTPQELLSLKNKQEELKKKIVLEMYIDSIVKQNLKQIERPDVSILRLKLKDETLSDKEKDDIKYMILVENHFRNMSDETKSKVAREQHISKLSCEQLRNLQDKVYSLYELGKLNIELTNQMSESLSKIYVPSEREIEESKRNEDIINEKIKKYEVPENVIEEVPENVEKSDDDPSNYVQMSNINPETKRGRVYWYNKITNKKTFINPNIQPNFLSKMVEDYKKFNRDYRPLPRTSESDIPFIINSVDDQNMFALVFKIMLKIKGKYYPTISHYITTNLFLNINAEWNINDVYSNFTLVDKNSRISFESFRNINEMNDEYFRIRGETYNNKIKELAVVGLNKKFENEDFQYDLLITETSYLVWNDMSDLILGGDGRTAGENFVGKYLMRIRENVRNVHTQETVNPDDVSAEDISKIVKNRFIKKFIGLQVNNICKFALIIKRYKKKNSKDMFNYVFNNILNKSSPVYNVTSSIPDEFCDIVNKECRMCLEIENFVISDEILEKMWNYIWSMIFVIINHVKTKSEDGVVNIYEMSRVIRTVQDIQTLKKTNVENIIMEDDLNQIVNCLVNVTTMMNVDKKIIQKKDIDIATSLILGKDIRHIENTDILTQSEPVKKSEVFDENEINIDNIDDEEQEDVEAEEYQNPDDIDEEEKEYDYDDLENGPSKIDEEDDDKEDEKEESNIVDTGFIAKNINYNNNPDLALLSKSAEEEEEKIVKDEVISKSNLLNVDALEYDEKDAEILSGYLQNNENFKDNDDCNDIAIYMLKSALVIKNYNKMYNYVKRNRLNFFS
jgi:predicted NAD-dependent protein-ADP-ribosyltransferase YbiA (DUF1768 family)